MPYYMFIFVIVCHNGYLQYAAVAQLSANVTVIDTSEGCLSLSVCVRSFCRASAVRTGRLCQ